MKTILSIALAVVAAASGLADDGLEERVAELEKQVSLLSSWVAVLQDGGNTLQTMGQLYEAGVAVDYVTFGSRQTAVVGLPQPRPAGEVPLIVLLHGYGSGSAAMVAYSRLHQRMNRDGFALLIPNGSVNRIGNRFWNANDWCCDFYDSGIDDSAALRGLIQQVVREHDLGSVYFFGHSNGGSMSYRMACDLAHVRAIVSLAGSSSRDPNWCADADPVSVLQISGTADTVIWFQGNDGQVGLVTGEPEFYLGALDLVKRWGDRAGCAWPDDPQPYATMDLDEAVGGAETQAYRLGGCAEGVSVELWVGDGSGHSPGYGDAFADALLSWLLAR